MAAAPRFKVYIRGEYVAAVKHPEDGGAILGLYSTPEGEPENTLRDGHKRVVYRDGVDGIAADSVDVVAQVAWSRV